VRRGVDVVDLVREFHIIEVVGQRPAVPLREARPSDVDEFAELPHRILAS
jgi:hypothetical protein